MTENDLIEKLQARYAKPQWAFLPQVRNTTGFSGRVRTADGIAMSLWPSRGLHLHGFEIKVRRGDWLKELKQPEKAEEIARFCNFWWIVAPKDVVKLEELPALWGLLVPGKKDLRVLVAAKEQDAQPPTLGFLASVLKSAQDVVTPDARLEAARKAGFKKGAEAGRKDSEHHVRRVEYELGELKKCVETFEAASGVSIRERWNAGPIGKAVQSILRGSSGRVSEIVVSARQAFERQLEVLKRIEAEVLEGQL